MNRPQTFETRWKRSRERGNAGMQVSPGIVLNEPLLTVPCGRGRLPSAVAMQIGQSRFGYHRGCRSVAAVCGGDRDDYFAAAAIIPTRSCRSTKSRGSGRTEQFTPTEPRYEKEHALERCLPLAATLCGLYCAPWRARF